MDVFFRTATGGVELCGRRGCQEVWSTRPQQRGLVSAGSNSQVLCCARVSHPSAATMFSPPQDLTPRRPKGIEIAVAGCASWRHADGIEFHPNPSPESHCSSVGGPPGSDLGESRSDSQRGSLWEVGGESMMDPPTGALSGQAGACAGRVASPFFVPVVSAVTLSVFRLVFWRCPGRCPTSVPVCVPV